jgi:glycosyltransferase involved in cell wall biosynthesis
MVRTVHNNFPFEGLLRQRKSLERWLCRLMGSRHIAISPSVQQNELSRFGNETTLCWNWFDTDRFRPPTPEERVAARAKLGIPPKYRAVVSVGNGSDVKNYRVILEALASLDDTNLHYYQVGNSHPDKVDQSLAKSLGVSSRVHFVGPQNDVLSWLWASDLYVMPSLFEGYGLAAVEAMAAGCDCLLSESPGLSDFRESELHVRWAQSDKDSFGQAMVVALETPIPSEQTLKTSNKVRSLFSVENRSKSYHDLWNEAKSEEF